MEFGVRSGQVLLEWYKLRAGFCIHVGRQLETHL